MRVETAIAETLIADEHRLANRLPESALAISKGEKVALDATGQQEEKVLKIDAVKTLRQAYLGARAI
ncbi:MAG: hypothetical protein U5N53_10115 [Mycobacterium sp.]|nr:hypothetical protein [Mycobacterium sp.]